VYTEDYVFVGLSTSQCPLILRMLIELSNHYNLVFVSFRSMNRRMWHHVLSSLVDGRVERSSLKMTTECIALAFEPPLLRTASSLPRNDITSPGLQIVTPRIAAIPARKISETTELHAVMNAPERSSIHRQDPTATFKQLSFRIWH